ncbi:MAG: carboxypeptidase-like regulatory domain-containing protein [Enhygromyxa sp.]
MRVRLTLGLLLMLGSLPGRADAAPPASERELEEAELRGRVLEAGGSRRPIAGAVVLLVDAPADVRPGQRPRDSFDPEAVAWTRRVETDADGQFTIEAPIGKARLIVIAGGYARFEQWAEITPNDDRDDRVELYLRPEAGGYRTEVRVERRRDYAVEPEHVVDAQEARHHAGSGDDPLLAAQNLPGIARSPGGFGMLGFRGGDPSEAGVYLDHHPIPRAYHVLPIASVVSPPMVARVQLSPGNYSSGFGSFGGGLVEIESRPGRRDGVHGQAHIDLFDFGGTIEGPVGDGSVHVGVRRSHVGDVLRAVPGLPIISPYFWDYLGRFDYPIAPGHHITLRALGAGDRLTDHGLFDFKAGFHRFDLEYRRTSEQWSVLISPSLRLDASALTQNGGWLWSRSETELDTRVYSFRAVFTRHRLTPWLSMEFGSDVVAERWRRRLLRESYTFDGVELGTEPHDIPPLRGDQLRLGVWFGLPLDFGSWRVVPAVRANLFAYSGYPKFRLDPRLDVRGRVHPRVELLGALGMYSTPVVIGSRFSSNLISQNGEIGEGKADVPGYLFTYFEPNIGINTDGRLTSATYVVHGSAGVQLSLPWELEARATGFWREGLPITIDRSPHEPYYHGRRRSMGAEFLLRRSLAGGVLDGWIGYTLMWARVGQGDGSWLPAVFDQRHNFVALLSAQFPRGFRLGMRFRLVSGNPETPVVGREISAANGNWEWYPIRAPRGTSYQPLFHQLDLRLDKRWTLDRTSVSVYLDVQNVYNQIHPEVWVYSRDWSERSSLLGLPIYPSVGVLIDF